MIAVTRNTTSDRSIPPAHPPTRRAAPLSLRLMRLGFRYIGPHLRGTAGRLAYRLWFSTHRHPEPKRETQWLADARIDRLDWRGRHLTRYQWGAAAAPAVLLIHGWNGRGSQLGAFAAPLTQAGLRAVSFDAPAHGRSPGSSTNILDYAEAIRVLAEASGPVVGAVAHSFGVPASTWALRQGLALPRLVSIAAPADAEFLLDRFAAALQIPAVVLADMRQKVEQQFGMDIFARLATEAMLTGQNLPGLIIHDRRDREVPSDHAERLHRAWPASRLLLVDGLGHQRLLRDPEVVAATVAFLTDALGGGDIGQAAATAAIMQPANSQRDSNSMKRYGIRGRLPAGDPMRAAHLLGEDWEWTRWYESEAERDAAFADMHEQFRYYRRGDQASQVLSKIERDA